MLNDMRNLFYGCKSLQSLSDISKWDLSHVKDMSNMFNQCCSLKSFTNLSKWDTYNVITMDGILY